MTSRQVPQRPSGYKVQPGESARRLSGSSTSSSSSTARGRMSGTPGPPNNTNRMPAGPQGGRGGSSSNNHNNHSSGSSNNPQQQQHQKGRNPAGSPPPNQRNTQQQQQPSSSRRQHQTASATRRGNNTNTNNNDQQQQQPQSSNSVDEAARAALALAAVAQAASASNKSPAEAAEIAKAQAHHIAKKQSARRSHHHHQQQGGSNSASASGQQQQHHHSGVRPDPRKMQTVNFESVKSLLRSEVASSDQRDLDNPSSKLLEKLADGTNDSFLQHLLMIEHLRCPAVTTTTTTHDNNSGDGVSASIHPMEDDVKTENMKTAFACERVKMILDKAELAFDSLHGMLPSVVLPGSATTEGQEEYHVADPYSELDVEDVEAPQVVPDLLPPCTSKPGDATLEFFKSCVGNNDEGDDDDDAENNKAESDIGNSSSITGSSSSVFDSISSPSVVNKDTFVESAQEGDSSRTSMLSSMFSMKRPSFVSRRGGGSGGGGGGGFASSIFGKKRRGSKHIDDVDHHADHNNTACEKGEYTVQIEREMLGLTVENVLERTVVRTVLPGGPAKKAGAKVGSLIVKVGNIETKNLTHFETIDELRQSQRPLQLVLRQISDEALRSAREEMGRLIRGSGFGKVFDGEPSPESKTEAELAGQRIMVGSDKNIDVFTAIMRKRWVEAANQSTYSKKDEPILRVGEKLVWILTLFIIGLERESERLFALAKENEEEMPERSSHTQYHHTAKDYADAAKSVSKVLFDFLKKRLDPAATPPPPPPSRPPEAAGRGMRGGRGRGRGPRGGRGTSMVPGVPDPSKADEGYGERLLLQIGDVLQRTRTFLADPTSPPAAMLRGEVIACLCDILDADSEMKLSDEETASQTQGGKGAGSIADLGSAGSLLKLIVLNCPIMRSPGCEEISKENCHIDKDELKRRFGEKKEISGSDYHRLHAGNRFLAVVHRLAASRSTSARITACSLGPVLWSHLDFPHQLQVCAFLCV